MKSKTTKNSIAYMAWSGALASGSEVQLLPPVNFRARDGRPQGMPGWKINAKSAGRIIAELSALANPMVIDYEHQSQRSAENGQPAPAAGWIDGKTVTWREGEGMFASAKWTDRAQLHIDADEYKFLSPVIAYDRNTGEIKNIISVALTNIAAIDGMNEVSARLNASLTQESLTMDMDELLEQLRWMLNLPTLATQDEVLAELAKAVATIKTAQPAATAAAGFSITGLVASLGTEVASLKTATPDPAKFVPVEVMTELQTEVAALRSEKIGREVGEVVTAALAAGKLLPAQEKWARELGVANMSALTQYVETAQPIAALSSTQTGGKPAGGLRAGDELSEAELKLCASMGVKPEDYKKTKTETALAV